MKRLLIILLFVGGNSFGQRLSVGITFQYLMVKQVKLNQSLIPGATSYTLYQANDNRWKVFSAGQSIVIGTVVQLSYKKFYVAAEPEYELNTYNYTVKYPLSPTSDESVTFKTLFFQTNLPLYIGFQVHSSEVIRYSIFAGASGVLPYHLELTLKETNNDPSVYNRYSVSDFRNILYNDKPYVNTLLGVGINFASLFRMDIRYLHRLGYPGELVNSITGQPNKATFNTLGVGLTFFLPMDLLKKRIYNEE